MDARAGAALPARVLVSGAGGFVGRAVVAALNAAGMEVIACGRTAPRLAARRCCAVGPCDGNTDWRPALAGVDAVVHLAARTHTADSRDVGAATRFFATNVAGSEQLMRQARTAGVQRFVYMSSIKVNGEGGLGPPDRVPRYGPADVPAPRDHYGRSKWQAEQRLVALAGEAPLALTVLRPPLVYGPGVRGNLRSLLGWIARGRPLPFARVDNLRSLLYVHNLADAVVAALREARPSVRTYTLADVDLSTPALVRGLADALEVRPRLWAIPPGVLTLVARTLRRGDVAERLLGSLLVDAGAARTELGWAPRVGLAAAFAATAAWFRDEANQAS